MLNYSPWSFHGGANRLEVSTSVRYSWVLWLALLHRSNAHVDSTARKSQVVGIEQEGASLAEGTEYAVLIRQWGGTGMSEPDDCSG
jgi:hypothetical protein